jgi:hypothetical protein
MRLFEEYSLPWVTVADDGNTEGAGASGSEQAVVDTEAAPNQASDAPAAPEAAPETAPDTQRVEIPLYARKMMDRFHSKAEQAEAQLAEARAELELLRRQQVQPPAGQAPEAQPAARPAPVPDNAYLEQRVAQEVARRQWQTDVAQAEEQGLKIHGENWANIISNINAMGGFKNNAKDLEFIIQTGKAPQIMAELAKVQNGSPLYEQVMAIPNEAKRFARLLELGATSAPAQAAPARPQSSNAPPPIDPITGRGTHAPPPNDLYDPKFNNDQLDSEWYRIRLEQKRARYQRA